MRACPPAARLNILYCQIEELIEFIKEYKEKNKIIENSSEADKLIAKMQEKKHTKEEYFETQQEVEEFMKSDVPEGEKQKVLYSGYPEWMITLLMIE